MEGEIENMEEHISFSDYIVISCGTLVPELNHLHQSGFLDAKDKENKSVKARRFGGLHQDG